MISNIESHRQLFARLITSGIEKHTQAALEKAFVVVHREDFLAPGPWSLFSGGHYIDTPTADPALLCHDIPVALIKDQGLNSGQPSLHAQNMAALDLQAGNSVVHIGAGSGYFSAVLSELVGSTGQVIAYEINPGVCQDSCTPNADYINWSFTGFSVTSVI